ncbi:MAG: isoamylase early set domain-containing protein [Actinomycetes bacterium]
MIRRSRVAKTGDVKLTFTLPPDEPTGEVSVVGTFNDWTPGAHRLVRRANGTRSASVTVPAGETVRFRYLGPDGHWFDEPDADKVDSEGSVLTT